jgi:tryptophanyl-tRNA synthetase
MVSYTRVLSGMRPTGRLHIGHYHGAIKSWVNLQYEHECFFMISDLQALTTEYEQSKTIQNNIYQIVLDWLACGVDPSQAMIFIQSQVPQQYELYTLLSMITPKSWLERVPSYKDQLELLSHKEIDSFGFLGYPLLHTSGILLYNAKLVQIGEDKFAHVELAREVARRFNYIYGREVGFEDKARTAMKKLGNKKAELYKELLQNYQQKGDDASLEKARFLLSDAINLSIGERERLFAFLENKSRVILNEPQIIVAGNNKIIGTDGQKMVKNSNNAIALRDDLDVISKKIKEMPTDPARIRRDDPGDPQKCPVWQLHQIYSSDSVKSWAKKNCMSAGIGCLECKAPLIESIDREQMKFKENIKNYNNDLNMIKGILADGAEAATAIAEQTIAQVKEAMDINY